MEGPLQKLLHRLTDTIPKSLGLGFVVTAILQSSSLISVITISFISAGLLSLKSGIGVVFGANLGTTVTAWLVTVFGLSIKVSALAMPMLIFGVLFVSVKSKNLKGLGYILAGLGFFFLGIHFMKEGFDVYKDSINLAEYAVTGFWGLILFTIIGVLITLVLQSSSAALALILTALAAGQIDYYNALALVIGANIGTTITAILGSLNANIDGKRLAGAHFIFKATTGILVMVLLVPMAQIVDFISDLIRISPDNYIIKLAIFHSIFNLTGVLIMIPFIDPLIRLLNRFIVDRSQADESIDTAIYLNETILAHPQTALKALTDESRRLFENAAFEIIAHGLNLHRSDIKSEKKLQEIVKKSIDEIEMDIDEMYYKKVKTIYSTIIEYATLAQSRFTLSREEVEAFTRIKLANRDIVESIKNIRGLSKNVNQYTRSENPYIRDEYNGLRHKVSELLRKIHKLIQDPDSGKSMRSFEILKDQPEDSYVLLNGKFDQLIRDQKISSQMATSLINDSDTVAELTKRLIDAAEMLYMDSNPYTISHDQN